MRGAIFDLDGTLADTAEDLLAAANAALTLEGLPLLSVAQHRHIAGRGGRAMLRISVAAAGMDPDAETDLIDALYPMLITEYAKALDTHTTLYDGVEACLDQLQAAGWRLGVCTNKPEELAVPLLDRLGLAGRFGAVLGANTLPVRKPDPEHVLETARRIEADPRLCVMIGDTATDLNAARNADIPCVLTTSGFSESPVADLGPDAIISQFAQLSDALERLCPAASVAANPA
ncbi:MAG: HAD-IA family hydrolase [Pseudomonadota bacterium]